MATQTFTYPGVYLEETAVVTQRVLPAPTNLTAFIGIYPRGPVDRAVLVSSWSDFVAQFGGLDPDAPFGGDPGAISLAPYAVWQFFQNGGFGAWIVRLSSAPAAASADLGLVEVTARNPGADANSWSATIGPANSKDAKFTLYPEPNGNGTALETINVDTTTNGDPATAISASRNVAATALTGGTLDPGPINFSGGAPDEPAQAPVGSLTITALEPGAWANGVVASLTPSAGAAVAGTTHVDFTLASADGKTVYESLTNLDGTSAATQAAAIESESAFVSASAGAAVAPVGPVTLSAPPTTPGRPPVPATATLGPMVFTANTIGPTPSVQLVADSNSDGLLCLEINGTAVATGLSTEAVALAAAINAASQTDVTAAVAPAPLEEGGDATWTADSFAQAVSAEIGGWTGGGPAPVPRLDQIAPEVFNIMCIPDLAWMTPQQQGLFPAAHQYCQERQAFLLVDPPPPSASVAPPSTLTGTAPDYIGSVGAVPAALESLLGVGSGTNNWGASFLGSEYIAAAAYYPWLQIADPWNANQPRLVPPSGTVAGVYATTDESRGVWKAPAGVDASLLGVTTLADTTITDEVNGQLNVAGINVLRTFPIYQNVVWGARTLAGADLIESEFKYVPARRLADFIEQSLTQSLKWAVFEPNGPPLWGSILAEVTPFMAGLYAQGAFDGATAAAAYSVACDATTTTEQDIQNGVVNIQVGFKPVEPAEFVVLHVTVGAAAPAAAS